MPLIRCFRTLPWHILECKVSRKGLILIKPEFLIVGTLELLRSGQKATSKATEQFVIGSCGELLLKTLV